MGARALSVQGILDGFVAHLRSLEERDGKLSRVARFKNGFEGWLKFELAANLAAERGYEPWVERDGEWIPGDVGVEHRARLAGTWLPRGSSKLIDLWVSPKAGADRWHFVELKVAFDNYNQQKMVASWHADFAALCALDDDEHPAGLLSLLVGVGFAAEPFGELSRRIARELPDGCELVHGNLVERGTPIHYAALLIER